MTSLTRGSSPSWSLIKFFRLTPASSEPTAITNRLPSIPLCSLRPVISRHRSLFEAIYPARTSGKMERVVEARGTSSGGIPGDSLERCRVLDHEVPARLPDGPYLPQLFHGPGDGDTPGPYHGGEFLVGVVGEDTIAVVAGHDPILFHELQDNAREQGRYLLERCVRDPPLVEPETLGEELYGPDSQLGLSTDEPVKSRATHKSYPRRRDCLGIRTHCFPGGESGLAEYLPCLQHAHSELPPRLQTVDAYPPIE